MYLFTCAIISKKIITCLSKSLSLFFNSIFFLIRNENGSDDIENDICIYDQRKCKILILIFLIMTLWQSCLRNCVSKFFNWPTSFSCFFSSRPSWELTLQESWWWVGSWMSLHVYSFQNLPVERPKLHLKNADKVTGVAVWGCQA